MAKAKPKISVLRTLGLIVLAGLLLLFLDVVRYFFYPYVGELAKTNPAKTAFMEFREEQWEREGRHMKIRQTWVPLGRISPYLVKAVLIGEDDKFYMHEGFDFEAMQQALEKDMAERKFKMGASTISQQLAKNLYLSPSKNPIRKVKEAILTWRLEHALSKKRILELYLNVAEWGDGVFGIEAGARAHYGKSAASLSPEEAARMASVLPNPIRFDPRSGQRYVANRSRIILRVMQNRGVVVPEFQEIVAEAKAEPAVPASGDNATAPDMVPAPEPAPSPAPAQDSAPPSGQ